MLSKEDVEYELGLVEPGRRFGVVKTSRDIV
jgi:hypothetical protein